ncbi:MAG: hypothetical protein KA164_13135 [Rhodoferax sp.]|jgi:hypothetical protein|nr:hypothetical protein [Rhodoferax sp.]
MTPPLPDLPDTLGNSRYNCPECGGPMSRIPRRMIDRLISIVRPVQRYRCRNFACQWAGNIAVASGSNDPTDRPPL